MQIKWLIEDTDTRAGKVFYLAVNGLIIVSLVSFATETLPGLSPRVVAVLWYIEVLTVLAFTAEYLLRIVIAPDRRFIFSFYGIIDLFAILPFYIGLGIDLRSIRAVRLFRLFRIFKFARYGTAIRRFRAALASIREELILFLIAVVFAVYLSSVGIYYCEHEAQPEHFRSIFHCLWWSIVTLSTVGYGDICPITTGGKIFSSGVMVTGIGLVAVPSGLLASALTKVVRDDDLT